MRNRVSVLGIVMIISAFCLNAQEIKKTLYVSKAGEMISEITKDEANSITELTITGNINAIDFRYLRNDFGNLKVLDISNANIKMYTGKLGTNYDKFTVYQANYIPVNAFCQIENGQIKSKQTLRKVILSEKIRNIESGAFLGCNALHICKINRKEAPGISENALSDATTAIFIPIGSRDSYRAKGRWDSFALLEGEPTELSIHINNESSLKAKLQSLGIQPKDVNFLTITGKLDVDDLKLIMDYMQNIVELDISQTNVTLIPDFTFTQKKYLLKINLPSGLKTIGQRAFSGCVRLSETLVLPKGITSLGYGAFMGCDKLKQVVVTGNQLTAIGENLFGDSTARLKYL